MPHHRIHSRSAMIALLIAAVTSSASAQTGFATQFGTSASDMASGIASGHFPNDYSFICGSTQGSLGGMNQGGWDAFIRSEYPTWTRQLGSAGDDLVLAICRDGLASQSGAIIAGSTTGHLEPGGHLGGDDAFIARYDRHGNRLWLRQFGTPGDDVARALILRPAGGFFVAGSTSGDLAAPGAGGLDAFIARHDANGERVWIRQFGASGDEIAFAMAPDQAGGAFVTGDVSTPGAGTDVFIARYDSTGALLWYRQFGSPADDHARAMSIIWSTQDVMIGGSTAGDLGGQNAGETDVWLARYDALGHQVWLQQFGTPEAEELLALTPDGSMSVGAAGWTRGTLDPSNPNRGGKDAFLVWVSAGGHWRWPFQFGTPQDDVATAIASGFRIAGYTDGQLGWTTSGSRDAFYTGRMAGCYPDCDGGQWGLNIDDFTCFMNEFAIGQTLPHQQQITHYANCDASSVAPVLNIDDFTCFLNAFSYGCE
jgi:hypothetical protein